MEVFPQVTVHEFSQGFVELLQPTIDIFENDLKTFVFSLAFNAIMTTWHQILSYFLSKIVLNVGYIFYFYLVCTGLPL